MRASEAGLTLIETMASILIFSIMTLGITPLLVGSLRGTALSRSFTVGKNLSNRVLERARSLPFFESVRNQTPPVRRDVLDLYFPNRMVADGFDATLPPNGPTFTTTCSGTPTAGSRVAAACPSDLPAGYTLTIVARFVAPAAGSGPSPSASPQAYAAVEPSSGYDWSTVSSEAPPSSLLELSITSNWTVGTGRSYNLTSFVGDRRLSPDLYSGNARLNYVVRALTSYVGTEAPNQGAGSQLEAVAGTAESNLSNRSSSRADEVVNGGRITLAREQGTATDDPLLRLVSGASVPLTAPPTETTPDVAFSGGFSLTTDGPGEVIHPHLAPSFGTIAYLDDHLIEGANTTAAVSSAGAPSAQGRFSYGALPGLDGASTLFVNNQIERAAVEGQATDLQLDPTKNIMTVERQAAAPGINGCTAASAVPGPTSVGSVAPTCSFSNSTNAVGAAAGAGFAKLRVFPVKFIPSNKPDTSVIVVDNFTMSISCRSTSAPGSAVVSGRWSASLKVWSDPTSNDLVTDGDYQTYIIGGAVANTSPAPVNQLSSVGNPLVYDGVGVAGDRYLFTTDTVKGYLVAGGLTAPALLASSTDAATRTAQVNANNPAIQIVTVPTDPARPKTSLTVDVGSMSCATVDKRAL